jgi:hypothetical protein
MSMGRPFAHCKEAEQLEARPVFRAMLVTFVARLPIGLTFAIVVPVLPSPYAVIIALGWAFCCWSAR